jgi:hypothetical protein
MIRDDDRLLATAFEDRPRTGWRPNLRGNLVRGSPDGRTLTVFRRAVWFGWSIQRGAKVTFSARLYRDEAAACEACWQEWEKTRTKGTR